MGGLMQYTDDLPVLVLLDLSSKANCATMFLHSFLKREPRCEEQNFVKAMQMGTELCEFLKEYLASRYNWRHDLYKNLLKFPEETASIHEKLSEVALILKKAFNHWERKGKVSSRNKLRELIPFFRSLRDLITRSSRRALVPLYPRHGCGLQPLYV